MRSDKIFPYYWNRTQIDFYTRKIIYDVCSQNETAEHPFMDLTTGSRVCSPQGDNQGNNVHA